MADDRGDATVVRSTIDLAGNLGSTGRRRRPPTRTAEPEGFLVTADDGTRLHFHDWGGPATGGTGVLLLPGLLQPAWSWAPVARRVRGSCRTVVADLRGHGLSDAPMTGYDLDTLAADAVAVVDGSGVLGDPVGPVLLAGHGFGAQVAARAAVRLGARCAGLVLVDGGFERLDVTTELDVDEFLRGMEEPPEVLRSMAAWLDERWAFDPSTWDADQERAARDAVVETAAGHVVRAVRPHVVEAVVRSMFDDDPATTVAEVGVDGDGPGCARRRRGRGAHARAAAGGGGAGARGPEPHPGGDLRRRGPQPDALSPGRGCRGDPGAATTS